jgi:CheY-like chemotaxis protein
MLEMKLFVTGASPTSRKAVESLTKIASSMLHHGYRLEVIDVLDRPDEASAAGVFCTPMLVKRSPGPEAWMLGDFHNEERLRRVLEPTTPAAPRSLQARDARPALMIANQRVPIHSLDGTLAADAGAPAQGAARTDTRRGEAARPKQIVVIDDYEGIHDSFRVALDSAYVDVISARTGDLGVEAVRACDPQLIYLDLKMPGKDGVATLRDIRADNEHAPVIIMTAFAEEFMTQLRAAHADGLGFELLSKPLDIDELYLVSAVATGGFGPSLA